MLPVAFALGCTIIVQFELQLVGQQFDNMFTTTVSILVTLRQLLKMGTKFGEF